MRISTRSAAAVFAAVTFAVAASPSPAEAFFLNLLFRPPLIGLRPSKPWPGAASKEETVRTVKTVRSSTATKPRDDDKSTSASAGNRTRSITKAYAKDDSDSVSARTPRRAIVKHEPASNKGGGSASIRAKGAAPTSTANTTVQNPGAGNAGIGAQGAIPNASSAGPAAQGTSFGAGTSTNIGDVFDETLGEVFKARIEELLKPPSK
jgi:hypothetical protein